jgi:hypothetical protein
MVGWLNMKIKWLPEESRQDLQLAPHQPTHQGINICTLLKLNTFANFEGLQKLLIGTFFLLFLA